MMKPRYACSAFAVAGLAGALLLSLSGGCRKSDSPLGLGHPDGLDVPSPTQTPVSGPIMAAVYETHGSVNENIEGVTVMATDPNGVTSTSTTDLYGTAAFNPVSLPLGVWTLTVPKQGHYGLSTQALTIVNSNESRTAVFRAGDQTLSATPVTNETYDPNNTNIVYNLAYHQPYNLDVPVTVATPTGLPAVWTNTLPVTLNADKQTASVTIIKTGCFYQKELTKFLAIDFLNQSINSCSATIERSYQIPTQLNFSLQSLVNTMGHQYTATCQYTLTSAVDCGVTWTAAVSFVSQGSEYQFQGGGVGASTYNSSVTLTGGNSATKSVVLNQTNCSSCTYWAVIANTTVSSPIGSYSQSVTFNFLGSATLFQHNF